MNLLSSIKKSLNTDFVDRKYAFEAIDKLWTIPASTPCSMLFWGDWSTGKSEILWNIDKRCQDINVAYVNLQSLGGDREAKDVWAALVLGLDKIDAIALVGTAIFRDKPYSAFVKYLEQALDRYPDRELLLAIDEYEVFLNIPEAATILKQLEELTLKHDRLAFLLCGSHDIGWDTGKVAIDFNPTRRFRLGFFTKEETAMFCNQQPYKFYPEAIDRLYEFTNGQPLLVRSICFSIISEFQWATEQDHEIRTCVTVSDVEDIANSDRFYESNRPFFAALWGKQISRGSTTLQQVLLELADDSDGLTIAEVARYVGTRHTQEICEVCQAAMVRHVGSLIEKINEGGTETYRVAIELFRRWIFRTQK
ncbi:hypothetical protein QT972_16615 [Microcoleus sp. herbarium7]|uniref:hypothetical protein n=1 Tax=Microcoleus sp. herbarium7 TaxID=3055435 RepID=UPI002FCED399